jgi:solute carrier family 1 (high affinity glutamate transporter) protein 2
LIAKTILNACSISLLFRSLGLYIVTVLTGFLIHSTVILPLTVFILSRQYPIQIFRSV